MADDPTKPEDDAAVATDAAELEVDEPDVGDDAVAVDPAAAEEAARAAAELEAAEAALDLSEPEVAPAGPIEEEVDDDEEVKLDWYILKVQSNRERSIAAALQRKVAIEGLDNLFGEILVPTEKVTEFKGGKKKIVERKIWPGYIAVQMHVNDDTWFAIRETSGIGDFTGASGSPTPMAAQDVAKILHQEEEETDEAPKLNIPYKPGDKIKVNDGNFESFEGEVSEIDDQSGKVTIMISIFGRSTPVELDYWQVEAL
ncbi:MAG: transcription termination/antitermination protein NusG [Planctomycetota bacterium]